MIWLLSFWACTADSAKDLAGSDSAAPWETDPCVYGYDDEDGDGYGGTWAWSCEGDLSETQDDCDDQDPAVSPAAVESCATSEDDDCDGDTNDPDASGCSDWYADRDSDGFGGADTACLCRAEVPYTVTTRGDCDDTAAEVVPGDGACGLWGAMSLTDATATMLGPETPQAAAGWSVAMLGDTDGDGGGDLGVSSPMAGDDETAGAAWIVVGVPSGESRLDEATAVLTGDADWYFGWSIAGPGDMDGDGYTDALVGSTGSESGLGAAWLISGPLAGALAPGEVGVRLGGVDTGTARDVSGANVGADGLAVWVADVYDDDWGAAYLIPGPVTEDASIRDIATAVVLNHNGGVSSLVGMDGDGDADGDGVDDLLLGSPAYQSGDIQVGLATLSLGPFDAISSVEDADLTLIGDEPEGQVGSSVAFTGDNDGDGLEDLLVGASGVDALKGAAAWFPGTSRGRVTLEAANALIMGRGDEPSEDTRAGAVVGSAGDQDQDGLDDVLVPIWGTYCVYLFAAPLSGTLTGEHADGRVRYDPGGISGLFANASSVAADDINGDGWPDVLIGIGSDDYVVENQGAAYLFMGAGL